MKVFKALTAVFLIFCTAMQGAIPVSALDSDFYEKNGSVQTFLTEKDKNGVYFTGDASGHISESSAKTAKGHILGRRYAVPEYRSTDYMKDWYSTGISECDYENGRAEIYTFFPGGVYDGSLEGFNRDTKIVQNYESDMTDGGHGKVWRVEKQLAIENAEVDYIQGYIAPNEDVSVVTFDLKPTFDNIFAGINIISKNSAGKEVKSVSLTFEKDGSIRADMGWTTVGETAGTKIGTWKDEKWLNLRIVHDRINCFLTVFIDGKEVKRFDKASLGEYGSEGSFCEMSSIRFYVPSGVAKEGTALFCIDNFKTKFLTPIERNGGRYKIAGVVSPKNRDAEIGILKNGEEVWRQFCPKGEKSSFDLGIFLQENDVVEAEVFSDEECEMDWNCECEKYIGTKDSSQSTALGYSYEIDEEFSLGELIDSKKASMFSERRDISKEMKYNQTLDRWENPDSGFVSYVTGNLALLGEGGYVSKNKVQPGNGTDSVIKVKSARNGVLKIDGSLKINAESEGILCRIYKNDELIWSNRVGGERPVRWDEPYDVSYFCNEVNVTSAVKKDDELKFVFNQWRKLRDSGVTETADISGIKLKYINGSPLAETTIWKTDNALIFNAENDAVYRGNQKTEADMYRSAGGEVYIKASDAREIFGDIEGSGDYLPLTKISEEKGKNILEIDNMTLVYDYLPTFFGYGEISEIKTAAESFAGIEEAKLLDENGKETAELEKNREYVLSAKLENTTALPVSLNVITALYGDDDILKEAFVTPFCVSKGETLLIGGEGENRVKVRTFDDTKSVRVFFLKDLREIAPLGEKIFFEVK